MPQPFWSHHSTTLDPMLVLAEIEHRIANEYTLAISSLNVIARTCDGDARKALERAAARLRDHALAHRALLPPIAADALDLSEYLRDVCRALTSANLVDRGITLTLHETSLTLEAWRAWRVGLILSELISNSLRHGVWPACGGAIHIELSACAFNIQCRVTDNGQGIKTGSIGTGTHILAGLIAELCGHIQRTFCAEGAIVLVTFPRLHPITPGLHGNASAQIARKGVPHDV